MEDIVFSTGGDWDSTSLYNRGQEILAAQLCVDLTAGRDDFGEIARGGISAGGEITAFIRTQAEPDLQMPIFPGKLTLKFPKHVLEIENTYPQFLFEGTRVGFDHEDVSNQVTEIKVNIDAENNIVQAYLTLFKPHMLAADEVATYTLI